MNRKFVQRLVAPLVLLMITAVPAAQAGILPARLDLGPVHVGEGYAEADIGIVAVGVNRAPAEPEPFTAGEPAAPPASEPMEPAAAPAEPAAPPADAAPIAGPEPAPDAVGEESSAESTDATAGRPASLAERAAASWIWWLLAGILIYLAFALASAVVDRFRSRRAKAQAAS